MNNSTLGEISVLTPSQKREQERQRKEKEEKAAAMREKKMLAAAKKKAEKEKKQVIRGLLWILYICIIITIIYFLIVGYRHLAYNIYGEEALDTFMDQIGTFILGGEFYWMITGGFAILICKRIYRVFELGTPIE